MYHSENIKQELHFCLSIDVDRGLQVDRDDCRVTVNELNVGIV